MTFPADVNETMETQIAANNEIPQTESRQGAFLTWPIVGCALLLLSHLPLLYWHLCTLLAKPHYQFVMLLPVAIIALAWQRREEIKQARPGKVATSYALGLVSLSVLGLATYLWSPWLGAVAAMFATLWVIYVFGGWRLVRSMLPAWLMLSFAVALPFELDEVLIQHLRQQATDWTSAVLDQFGFRHLIEGNVIRVPDKSFFVADACTGIHSLFVVSAMALFLGLWNVRRLHQVIVLLVCAVVLVMIENITRLVAVVAIFELGMDVSEGWRHQVLGAIVFVGTLALLVSADQLVSVVVPERIRFWRRRNKIAADTSSPRQQSPGASATAFSQLRLKPLFPILIGFAAVGLWQLARAPASVPQISEILGNPYEPLRDMPAEVMPAAIGQWVQKDHRFVERAMDDPQGQFSHLWRYERGGRMAEISLDYTYPGMHDACLCFTTTGWLLERQKLLVASATEAGIVEAHFVKPLGGSLFLLASSFNPRGEFGARLFDHEERAVGERIGARLNSFLVAKSADAPPGTKLIAGPVAQIRLAVDGHPPLADTETAQIADVFHVARVKLRDASIERIKGGNSRVESEQ